jgi:anti-anti-sigma factor
MNDTGQETNQTVVHPGEEQTQAVVHPAGDVVAASIGALRQEMQAMMSAGVRQMTVDLTDVRMIDSRGIGLLISAHNSLHKQGGTLAVVHASKDILDLLRTMRIHQHFSVTGDE